LVILDFITSILLDIPDSVYYIFVIKLLDVTALDPSLCIFLFINA